MSAGTRSEALDHDVLALAYRHRIAANVQGVADQLGPIIVLRAEEMMEDDLLVAAHQQHFLGQDQRPGREVFGSGP